MQPNTLKKLENKGKIYETFFDINYVGSETGYGSGSETNTAIQAQFSVTIWYRFVHCVQKMYSML